MEEKLIEEIRGLFEQIEHIRFEGSPSSVESLAMRILGLIDQLIANAPEGDQKSHYIVAFEELSHTIGKEVHYIAISYKKTLKKNAARVRTKEYQASLKEAIQRIKSDIFMIVNES